MTRYGHIGWRVAAVVAFAGTAVLAITLTRAPVSQKAALSANISCPPSGLQAWLGLGTPGTGVPAAGGTYYTLEFTNVSDRTCSLYGYPEVSAYASSQRPPSRSSGRQIGSAAIRDTSVRPRQVMLQPGATAHSVLQVTVTGAVSPTGCVQVIAQELRVALPDKGRASYVPVHIPVCSRRGHVSLSVQAIQARPGIPGQTMS